MTEYDCASVRVKKFSYKVFETVYDGWTFLLKSCSFLILNSVLAFDGCCVSALNAILSYYELHLCHLFLYLINCGLFLNDACVLESCWSRNKESERRETSWSCHSVWSTWDSPVAVKSEQISRNRSWRQTTSPSGSKKWAQASPPAPSWYWLQHQSSGDCLCFLLPNIWITLFL